MDKEKLIAQIIEAGAFTAEDQHDLLQALSAPYLQRALRCIYTEADIQNSILGVDLTTQEGVIKAQARQAHVSALRRAVDILLDLAEEKSDGT